VDVPETFYDLIETVCRDLYVESLKKIPPDVVAALRRAAQRETKEVARRIFSHYLQSIELGQTRDMLVCQDTGIPVYWVDIGGELRLDGSRLHESIVRGTERATREHSLRSSIVAPLTRENRQTSTGDHIPIVHYNFAPGSGRLDLLFMPKGSGSENMSFMKMLTPADGVKGIQRFVIEQVVGAGAKPCPPTIVGVGIGGSSDLCLTLAKKATLRPVGSRHSDPHLAALEQELCDAINQTGIGPQGLGGDTTALAVHIESAWTHITCNPVAVNLQCWRAERRRATLWPDGRVEVGF
jgi:fumarate hydratase subunit alpha/L(+)-tartrate dehydratase alpha subunit